MKVLPPPRRGNPNPLGATWDGQGTNFALFSEHATRVDLVLFDEADAETRIQLRERTDLIWHGYVEGVGPGQLYGYRVDGPWDPRRGFRFNPASVLLDPYAKAVSGPVRWDQGAFSYDRGRSDQDLARAETDQHGAPRGIVIDSSFDWGDDAAPNVPPQNAIIYETHVKGLTVKHPQVPEEIRGTYLGLGSEPVIRHFRELGITAVELLPVHAFVDDLFLIEKGLRNYWGYNSISFFAPEVRYRAGSEVGAEVNQLKSAIKALHAAGIEVILDVVYNHTAEGNHLGPTFSFKGIDNTSYYRLVPDDARYYFDYTGTGNSLNVRHPQTLRLIMDSLRYWVQEMRVDGFRFDLASTLARSLHDVDRLSSFFMVINQDPVIGKAKLIAEPWDVGAGGYQVGAFPVKWSEWNDKYRDTIRAFWRGDGGRASDVGYRLTGSSDLYQSDGRSPSSSVNLITAHDGFTLRDLVAYSQKHNEPNQEQNRDGSSSEISWNCGIEGETSDPEINRLRWRQMRDLMATLLLSQGTPMICGGDEIGRTQRGNNNAYCQDNEISWYDWNLDDDRRAFLELTRKLIRIRKEHPALRRSRFLNGRAIRGLVDLVWTRPDGEPMTDEDWNNPATRSLGMYLSGAGIDDVDPTGRPLLDDDLLLILGASPDDLEFTIPAFHPRGAAQPWELLADSSDDAAWGTVNAETRVTLTAQSFKLFRRTAALGSSTETVARAPTSTYRVQLGPTFRFADLTRITGYLDELGVSAVYTSPYLKAERQSTHGYNVADHSQLDPARATEAEQDSFAKELAKRGIGHIMDFVPNHVGTGSDENAWWTDVLENGPASLYAEYFDIDWDPPAMGLKDRVLLPVLGKQFGEELESGRLSIARTEGAFWVAYYDRRWPAAPRSYRPLLERALSRLALKASDPQRQDLESIVTMLEHLPASGETARERRIERAREKEVVKRRLAALISESPVIEAAIDGALAEINPSADRPGEIDWLDGWLRDQNFRLAYWRVATDEVNYRRFFDVNELAAIRMERSEVFEATHALVLELIRRGVLTGLRLDHTDGLYEPGAYFAALQDRARAAVLEGGRTPGGMFYVVAEKILEPKETLPKHWRVAGTTGYDFLAHASGLWVDRSNERPLTAIYQAFTGVMEDYPAIADDAKREMMKTSLYAETLMLGQQLRRIGEANRRSRDFTLTILMRAITETIAALRVYRSYIRPDGGKEPNDEAHLQRAIASAKRRNPTLDPSVFDFLYETLILARPTAEKVQFAMRFQQFTGPVMAKGVEDTATYRYNRLSSLNEVGCDPSEFGVTTESFHAHNADVLATFPLTMTATSTHDTKRSEDVRARLAVLSEVPDEWTAALEHWCEINRAHKTTVLDEPAPAPNDEYLFYQTVLGALPFERIGPDFTGRIKAYLLKAAREAKWHTSWISPNAAYDRALEDFVERALANPVFVDDARRFVERIATYGATNSLAQVALKLASPGVPDTYQGTELWDFSLVDPDNRRPVDFEKRIRMLEELAKGGAPSPENARELLTHFSDGRIKMQLLRTGLRLRRDHRALFLEGAYRPIEAGEHVVAFERSWASARLVAVVPRLGRRLTGGLVLWPIGDVWGDREIDLGERGSSTNVFTNERFDGGKLLLRDLLRHLPVAWLWSNES